MCSIIFLWEEFEDGILSVKCASGWCVPYNEDSLYGFIFDRVNCRLQCCRQCMLYNTACFELDI